MARRGDANQAVDGKALPEMSALKPYWGKPAVRNFREGDGNNGIIEARSAPSPYSTALIEGSPRSPIAIDNNDHYVGLPLCKRKIGVRRNRAGRVNRFQ